MILFVWGEERLPVKNLHYGLSTDSHATSVGIKDGDVITAVNDKPLVYLDNLPKDMMLTDKVQLHINREGRDTSIIFPEGFIRTLTKNQLKGFVAPRIPVVVDSLSEGNEFGNKELRKGDQLLSINDHRFLFYDQFDSLKRYYKNQEVSLGVLRGGDTVNVKARLNEQGSIGFYPKDPYKILGSEKKEYSFFEAIPAGINYGVDRLGDYVKGIRLLFTSKEHKVSDNLGSVISIGKTFGGSWDWQRFWTMTALFSIILAFMNILPIPALDGGHALFTIYEMITGRKPSDKFMEYAQMVGMFLLLGLMLYAFGLDIWRLFR
jgi:regulator of sigma E protease